MLRRTGPILSMSALGIVAGLTTASTAPAEELAPAFNPAIGNDVRSKVAVPSLRKGNPSGIGPVRSFAFSASVGLRPRR